MSKENLRRSSLQLCFVVGKVAAAVGDGGNDVSMIQALFYSILLVFTFKITARVDNRVKGYVNLSKDQNSNLHL